MTDNKPLRKAEGDSRLFSSPRTVFGMLCIARYLPLLRLAETSHSQNSNPVWEVIGTVTLRSATTTLPMPLPPNSSTISASSHSIVFSNQCRPGSKSQLSLPTRFLGYGYATEATSAILSRCLQFQSMSGCTSPIYIKACVDLDNSGSVRL